MGSEWPTSLLEHLAAPEQGSIAIGPFGSRMKADCYVETGVALIRGTNLGNGKSLSGEFVFITSEKANELGNANLKPRDLVFPHRGAIGEVGIVPDDGCRYALSTSLMKITLDQNRAIPDFYYYFFKSARGQSELLKNASQVGTPGIATPLASLRACEVPHPPLGEQNQAADVLSLIDDRIDLLRQTNTTLEAIAQALFKSWFVDFDPVHAKAEGREPEAMDAATAALFPSEFEQSELGLIPKGWRAATFGELLKDSIGGDWGKDQADATHNCEVAIVRGTDLPDLRTCSPSRIPKRFTTLKKLEGRTLVEGDLVVEVSGGSKDQPTGRSLFITKELLRRFDCPVVPASFCRRFRPISGPIGILLAQHMDYIYRIGRTWEYQNQSTGIANFQTTHFLKAELLAVPPEQVLLEFDRLVGQLVERTQLREISALADLRDILLPRLISGKLRLPEATEAAEAALG
jgi:type I restriction enzyme S subunit